MNDLSMHLIEHNGRLCSEACSGIGMDLACHFLLQCGIFFVKCKSKSPDMVVIAFRSTIYCLKLEMFGGKLFQSNIL